MGEWILGSGNLNYHFAENQSTALLDRRRCYRRPGYYSYIHPAKLTEVYHWA